MILSVVTPVLNQRDTINQCIRSIPFQQDEIEHLVIDGGSWDGTVEVLKQYSSDKINYLSETDQSLYDAINKGISMSSGEILGILNADDFYADEYVLKTVAEIFENENIDSCYGDLEYVDRDNPEKVVRHWKAGFYDPKKFNRGWMPPHPTFFVRRSIYEKYGVYRLDMGTAADYELMLRFLLKHRISTVYIPKVLIKMRTGGVSNVSLRNRIKANMMDRKAWRVNNLTPHPWTLWMKPMSKVHQYLSL